MELFCRKVQWQNYIYSKQTPNSFEVNLSKLYKNNFKKASRKHQENAFKEYKETLMIFEETIWNHRQSTKVKGKVLLRYFSSEPSLKLQWCRARDLWWIRWRFELQSSWEEQIFRNYFKILPSKQIPAKTNVKAKLRERHMKEDTFIL